MNDFKYKINMKIKLLNYLIACLLIFQISHMLVKVETYMKLPKKISNPNKMLINMLN